MFFFNLTENSTVLQAMGTFNSYVPNKYLQSALILISVYILSKAFVWVMKTVVLTITQKTRTKIDDMIVERTRKPVSWLLIIIGARLALLPLELKAGSTAFTGHLLNSIVIIIITVILIRVVTIFINSWGSQWAKKTKSSIDDALLPLFRKAANIAIVILSAFFVFSEWRIDITGILAGVGIVGIALGFAVKDSLSNIFGGISLILDKAIQVGDYVEVNGTSGEVLDVGLRSTRIKTWDNDLMIIPNGTLANQEFKNWKLPDIKTRVTIKFGVEYGISHQKVKKIVLDVLKKYKEILKDPATAVRFEDMGDSALMFGTYFWIEDVSQKMGIRDKVLGDIYDTLNKNKIGIPFPTTTVYLKKTKR
ncbi:MAG: mechanosensitive ion channel family protein [Nanoarchaeota archaeon]|nr:mechanosensitive ion channel family protein [Nanoarchaeota archaeon]